MERVCVHVEGVEKKRVLRMCGGGREGACACVEDVWRGWGPGVCACGGGGLLAHDNDGFVACRFLTVDNQLIQVYYQFRYRRSPNSHFMSCNET